MPHIVTLVFALLAMLVSSASVRAQPEVTTYVLVPCPAIRIESPEPLELNAGERTLICGDPDTPAWRRIPTYQSRYFLKNFLEVRGYLSPEFTMEENALSVRTGRKTVFTELELVESPVDLPIDRFWEPVGRPLTPGLLDMIEGWVLRHLADSGYPCAKVDTQASKSDGKVRMRVVSGPLWHVREIDSTGIPGVLGGVERRFDAFSIGDRYDAVEFDLTSRRLIANDLVLNSTFLPDCEAETPGRIRHVLMPGKSRLLTFGFGFDTEEYLITRASWQNGRLFTSASRIQTQALASYRNQNLSALLDWYYLPFPSRHFLTASVEIRRRNERRFDTRHVMWRAAPAWQNDVSDFHFRLSTGPSYYLIRTIRGIGEDQVKVLSWDTDLLAVTEDFEYYLASPRSGHELSLLHGFAHVAMGSDVTARRWQLSSTHLWNAGWSPPIFIAGIRTQLATTAPGEKTDATDLPPTYRYYLGGAGDLRGFGRNALPPDDQGSLTIAYLGSELRINNVLPYKLQPLLFVDGGWLGEKAFAIDRENLFWSPGTGVRWESPVGTMRLTFAHGFIDGPKQEEWGHLSRWQFYFSFGEQF